MAGKFDEGMGEDGVDDMMGDEQAGGTLRTGRWEMCELDLYIFRGDKKERSKKRIIFSKKSFFCFVEIAFCSEEVHTVYLLSIMSWFTVGPFKSIL